MQRLRHEIVLLHSKVNTRSVTTGHSLCKVLMIASYIHGVHLLIQGIQCRNTIEHSSIKGYCNPFQMHFSNTNVLTTMLLQSQQLCDSQVIVVLEKSIILFREWVVKINDRQNNLRFVVIKKALQINKIWCIFKLGEISKYYTFSLLCTGQLESHESQVAVLQQQLEQTQRDKTSLELEFANYRKHTQV